MGISPHFAYHRLNTEQAGNVGLWRYTIDLQADRLRDALGVLASRERSAHEDAHHRVDADGHFLLVAVRNGMRFAEHLRDRVAGERLDAGLAGFIQRFPDACTFRDVLTHVDDYVLDKGRLQLKGVVEPGSSSWRVTTADGDVVFVFGPFAVPLLALASAAADLMAVAEEVWWQGLRDNADGVDEVASTWPGTE